MNFKKYHVSKNLVESYIASCSVLPNGVLISNSDFNMFIAKVEQGEMYCADIDLVGGYYTSLPAIGSVSYDGSRITFVSSPFIAPIDGYLAFRKASTETTAMMNEGSELLPYEPYSSEVWHDIPHYIYKAELETWQEVTDVHERVSGAWD